jgi:hypothetical protein
MRQQVRWRGVVLLAVMVVGALQKGGGAWCGGSAHGGEHACGEGARVSGGVDDPDVCGLWFQESLIERTNDRNFGSITAGKRLFGRTNGRTIGRTDERTMNDRTNDRTIGRTNEQTKNRGTNDRRTTERSLF